MATTSPDNIRTPNPTDPYNLVSDLAIIGSDTQTALVRRANLYVGTGSQRTAFTSSAPEGVHWQDTDGTKGEYVFKSGVWTGGDTGWVTPTLNSGYTAGEGLAFRRIGSVVYARGLVTKTAGAFSTATAGDTVGALPGANFRPVTYGRYPLATYGTVQPVGLNLIATNSNNNLVIFGTGISSDQARLTGVSWLAD